MSKESGDVMPDERFAWDQMPDEPSLWYGRFSAYLRLGTKRSVATIYKKENRVKSRQTTLKVPGDWYEIEKAWNWKERARAYDEHVRAEEDHIIAEEREKVLRSGFALQHKRIQALNRLTNKLIAMSNDEDKVWMPDVKSIGTGPTAERVDLLQFNAPLFTLIDKYLNSIAAEMGERVKKKELTGKDGGPVEYEIELVGNSPDDGEEDA
jgi:hypothetical protein